MGARQIRDLVLNYAEVLRFAVAAAVKAGDIRSWEKRVDWPATELLHRKKAKPILAELEQAAAAKARRAPVRKDEDDGGRGSSSLFFNEPNPYSVNWASTRSGKLITSISDSMRKAVRDYVSQAIRDGTPPRSLARQLQGVVGLRPDQAEALTRQRAELVEAGRAPDEIDRLLEARGTRMLSQRATMIARTELTAAQSAGAMNEWAQMAADGDLPADTTRLWMDADGCPVCQELAQAEPVALGKPWHSSILGKDVWAPPAHPHCRCTQAIA